MEFKKCDLCDKTSISHVTEYNTIEKVNKVIWYCKDHKQEYNFKYVPPIGMTAYKKFVDVSGINTMVFCSESGNSI